MDQYRVPMEQTTVLAKLADRPPFECVLYLSQAAEGHTGAETVHDLLLRAGAFLPLTLPAGGLTLVRKDALQWLRLAEPERAAWHYLEQRAGALERKIRCELSDGEAMVGLIVALTPAGERRVIDLVNRAEGFFHLETVEGLCVVNAAQVWTITILEEPDGET
jgi:hypothetical protein